MGAGKSKSVNRAIVEYEDSEGNTLPVDLDSDLIDRMQSDYEEDSLAFDMSDSELQEYLNSQSITPVYGWGLESDGDLETDIADDDRTVLISDVDPDLKYFMFTAMDTANKIQSVFQQSVGTDKKVVESICFDSPTENYELEGGVKGYANTRLIPYGAKKIDSMGFSYYDEYNVSFLTLNASRENRLPIDLVRKYKATGSFSNSSPSSFLALASERSSARSGWFSSSGSYAKTTVAHEMGHAVMTSLKEVYGKNFSKSTIKSWHERTYSSPVSGYAQRNANESFAECFSLYVSGGNSSSKMYTEFKGMMKDYGLEKMYGCINK